MPQLYIRWIRYGFIRLCAQCVCAVVVVGADDNEYKLVRDLMRNYDLRIRPSKNASESLNVTFGLALAQIIDVVSLCNHTSQPLCLTGNIELARSILYT